MFYMKLFQRFKGLGPKFPYWNFYSVEVKV